MNTPITISKTRKSAVAQAADKRPAVAPAGQPTHDSTAVRAYTIFISTGCRPGCCLRNWLQAEKELRTEGSILHQLKDDGNAWPLASRGGRGGAGPQRE
jgi:hypothetical protein